MAFLTQYMGSNPAHSPKPHSIKPTMRSIQTTIRQFMRDARAVLKRFGLSAGTHTLTLAEML